MSREVALAIGVAAAKKLPYLSGAVNAARIFHEWASKLGYDSKLLTDETDSITIPILRQEFESLLKPHNVPIHRLVLYFAGHGLIQEAEEALWLLSDWYDDQRAVAVEVLRRRLYRHDIQQITIFADCCRSLPADMLAADLTRDAVLGLGPVKPPNSPAIDKFIAAQDGTKTFSVPGKTPDEDRCLFSGVLMEGLWGMKPEAFSRVVTQKVTSRSLAAFLQAEVPRRAKTYDWNLNPSVSPTFPENDDIYFYPGIGNPPAAPTFSEWPSRPTLDTQVSRDKAIETFHETEVSDVAVPHDEVFESPDIADTIPRSITAKLLIQQIRDQERPQAFETGSGFAVDGGPVSAIWTTPDVLAESHGQPNWFRLSNEPDQSLVRSAPTLVEFEDGTFAAAVAIPGFIATFTRDERGVAALIYRRVHEPRDTAAAAELAIGKLESGALRSDTATDLAVHLRKEKHSDPVLGVISAYLYDSIGDIDSIRRMAFYYTLNRQPIPYDIALLAQLQGHRRERSLWAHVPAVPERKARTQAEQINEWTFLATHESEGEIAGFWPWMRQGWPFLDDVAEDGSLLVHHGLPELTRYLTPARFSTLTSTGANKLAKIFKLANRA
jgi:Caspase domain